MSSSEVFETPGARVVRALEQIVKDRSITPAGRAVARAALDDARRLVVDEGLWENVRLGHMEVAGTDESGQLRYRITEKGEARVRAMSGGTPDDA